MGSNEHIDGSPETIAIQTKQHILPPPKMSAEEKIIEEPKYSKLLSIDMKNLALAAQEAGTKRKTLRFHLSTWLFRREVHHYKAFLNVLKHYSPMS